MIVDIGCGGILYSVRLVPGDTLQNVWLRTGRNFIRPPVIFNLSPTNDKWLKSSAMAKYVFPSAPASCATYQLLQLFEFFRICAGWYELQWVIDSNGARVCWRAVGNPLSFVVCSIVCVSSRHTCILIVNLWWVNGAHGTNDDLDLYATMPFDGSVCVCVGVEPNRENRTRGGKKKKKKDREIISDNSTSECEMRVLR